MAGSPLKRRVIAALTARAEQRSSDDETLTLLDYAVDWVSAGRTISDLAQDIAKEIGTPVSRPLLSGILNATPDASARLEAARRQGAHAIMDDAVKIADDAEPTPGAVAKARLQVGTREWLAERFAPDAFGVKQLGGQVNISVGKLMLAALQAPPPPRPELVAGTAPLLASGDEAAECEAQIDES